MGTLQKDVCEWSEEAFGPGFSMATLTKLRGEVEELVQVIQSSTSDGIQVADELADCHIMLLQIAQRFGVDLNQATREKLDVNRQRSWTKRPDGTFQHDAPGR